MRAPSRVPVDAAFGQRGAYGQPQLAVRSDRDWERPVVPTWIGSGTSDGGTFVIAQVDDALRTLVRTEALDGSDVDVVFDAPTKDWAARRNAPTVNLYLYDIREDIRRRERG